MEKNTEIMKIYEALILRGGVTSYRMVYSKSKTSAEKEMKDIFGKECIVFVSEIEDPNTKILDGHKIIPAIEAFKESEKKIKVGYEIPYKVNDNGSCVAKSVFEWLNKESIKIKHAIEYLNISDEDVI